MELFNGYSLYPDRTGEGQGLLAATTRRGTGVPRPLRRPCRDLDRVCAASTTCGPCRSRSHVSDSTQLGREFASGEVGGETGPHLGLRRLPPFPLQLGGRGQRERPETGVVPRAGRRRSPSRRPSTAASGEAVAVTDNPAIPSPFNRTPNGVHPLNDIGGDAREARHAGVRGGDRRGHSGRCGHPLPDGRVPARVRAAGPETGTQLVLDETSRDTAARAASSPTVRRHPPRPGSPRPARMANGFPIGGVLIAPPLPSASGAVGNHLRRQSPGACGGHRRAGGDRARRSGGKNAAEIGDYLLAELHKIGGLKEVRGRGLMIGIEIDGSGPELRKKLLFDKHIFTGGAGASTVRLPALCLTKRDGGPLPHGVRQGER